MDVAIETAAKRRGKITSVDKANVLASPAYGVRLPKRKRRLIRKLIWTICM